MSFEEAERKHAQEIVGRLAQASAITLGLLEDLIVSERALASEQQVSITTYALRERETAKADLVTAQAKLAAIEALANSLEGDTLVSMAESIHNERFVRELRKILGGGT
jgi:hypothetical protein